MSDETKKTCLACGHCSIGEPDADYPVCYGGDLQEHPFGLYVKQEPLDHCPDFLKFFQHTGRNPDGTIKG